MARSARLYAIMVFPTPPLKEANPIDFNIVLPPVVITEFQIVVMIPKPMAVITGVIANPFGSEIGLAGRSSWGGGWWMGRIQVFVPGITCGVSCGISHYVDRK